MNVRIFQKRIIKINAKFATTHFQTPSIDVDDTLSSCSLDSACVSEPFTRVNNLLINLF